MATQFYSKRRNNQMKLCERREEGSHFSKGRETVLQSHPEESMQYRQTVLALPETSRWKSGGTERLSMVLCILHSFIHLHLNEMHMGHLNVLSGRLGDQSCSLTLVASRKPQFSLLLFLHF